MDTALQMLSSLAAFAFVASLKGAALIGVVLLIQKVAARYLSANARYLLWFPVVLALMMPIGFEVKLSAGLQSAVATAASEVEPVAIPAASKPTLMVPAPGGKSDTASFAAPPAGVRIEMTAPVANFAWLYVLQYLWLAGVGGVLGMVAVSCHRFSRIVRRSLPASPHMQAFLQECMTQTSCKARVDVRHSADINVPMIAGLLRPVLLLPAGLDQQLTPAQLRHIFIHELMHLQRGDIVSNWLVALVQALHWFNPAVWFAFFRMRQDRELACDAATLRHLAPAERATYGHTLLQLNDTLLYKPVPAVALGILESTSPLGQRIAMLMQNSREQKWQSVIAVLVIAPLAAIAFGQPIPAPAAIPALAPDAAPATVETRSVAEAAPAAPAPQPAAPATDASATAPTTLPAVSAEPQAPVSATAPVPQTAPVVEAAQQEEPMLLAQLDSPAAVDVFEPETGDNSIMLAAISHVQPDAAPSEPVEDLALTIVQVADAINAMKAEKLRFIEDWDPVATECAARKDDSLFGTLSKPCREVRVVQLRGDVFQFIYTCYQLDRLHAAQWNAYQGAAAHAEPGLAGVEEALTANEQELLSFCSKEMLAEQYPGFSTMFADAEALKYYNPWRRPGYAARYQSIPGASYPNGYPNPYYEPGSNFSLSQFTDGSRFGGGSYEYIGGGATVTDSAPPAPAPGP